MKSQGVLILVPNSPCLKIAPLFKQGTSGSLALFVGRIHFHVDFLLPNIRCSAKSAQTFYHHVIKDQFHSRI